MKDSNHRDRAAAFPNRLARWLACGCALLAAHAAAWNDAGHLAIAMRAYDALAPDVRARLVAIVRRHPRFAPDIAALRPRSLDGAAAAQLDRWDFAYASVWPDRAREFSNVVDPAQRQALIATYDRPHWHYINLPIDLDARDRSRGGDRARPAASPENLDIVQALESLSSTWRARQTRDADRAVALAWVEHLVADLHQPLHAASLYADGLFPNGDRGGNSIELAPGESLHRAWDEALGTRRQLRDLARIEAALPNVAAPRGPIDFAAWAREARDVAATAAYTDSIRGQLSAARARGVEGHVAVTLDARDRATLHEVAARQAALAAARLVRVLVALDGARDNGG